MPNMKVTSKNRVLERRVTRSPRTARSVQTAADLIRNIAEKMERLPVETWEGIPTDVSKNVDHYLYGSPKHRS